MSETQPWGHHRTCLTPDSHDPERTLCRVEPAAGSETKYDNGCRARCVYGECRPSWSDPYGCGECCRCLGGCRVQYEREASGQHATHTTLPKETGP